MFNIKSLKAKNFLVFSELNLQFDKFNNKIFIVKGVNNSDEGQESNGSGKSSFFSCIAFALIGMSISKRKKESELIKNNCKESELEIVLEINKETIKIIRKLYLKKSQEIQVFINDNLQNFVSTLEADKFIESYLGITFDEVLSYYIISKDRFESFISNSDTKKKEIISKFSKIDSINYVFENIEKEFNLLTNDLKNLSNKKTTESIKKDVLIENSKKESNLEFFENSKKEKIEMINNAISYILKDIDSINVQIKELGNLDTTNLLNYKKELNQMLEQTNLDLSKIKNEYELKINDLKNKLKEDIDVVKESISTFEADKKKNSDDINNLNKKIQEIKNKLHSYIECPNCKHKFSLEVSDSYDNLGAELNKSESEKNSKKIETKTIEDNILEFSKVLYDLQNFVNSNIVELKNKLNDKILEINQSVLEVKNTLKGVDNDIKQIELNKEKLKNYNLRIESFNNSIQVKKLEIEKIKSEVFIPKNYDKEIEQLDISINNFEKEIVLKQSEIDENRQWKSNFIDFKTYLINHCLEVIEYIVNSYLEKTKSSMSVSIDGFKKLSNGEIREKIDIKIIKNGKEDNFYKFSEGEKARIEICFVLALQTIINNSSEKGGINISCFDEILNSVDSKGILNLSKNLGYLNKTIFLVTHSGADIVYDNVLTVVKDNNESKLI